jgi:hypothetical protein
MAKDLKSMSPDEVCGWIQKQIRKLFGDVTENKTSVWASHGYYYIEFKKRHPAIVRRHELVNYFKMMKQDRADGHY